MDRCSCEKALPPGMTSVSFAVTLVVGAAVDEERPCSSSLRGVAMMNGVHFEYRADARASHDGSVNSTTRRGCYCRCNVGTKLKH